MYGHGRRRLLSCSIACFREIGSPLSSENESIAGSPVGGEGVLRDGGPVNDDMSWEGKAPALRMVSHTEVK